MLADVRSNALTNSQMVSRRFWTLLCAILAVAIAASAFAVRYTATPILEDQQRAAIDAQAYKAARDVETALKRQQLFLSLVGNTPDIVSVVMGYSSGTETVRGYLDSLERSEALSYITLFDAFGAPILDFDIRPEERSFVSEQQVSQLVSAWVAESTTASRRVGFSSIGDRVYLVLAEPVKNRGFIEGVMVAGYTFDVSDIVDWSRYVEGVNLVRIPLAEELQADTSVVRLNDFDLAISLKPNFAAVAEAGGVLIYRSTMSVAIVLIAAFSIFAALGRATLVEPHRKLELQKQSLKELAAIAESARESIVVTNEKGQITWTNPAFEKLSGYSADEVRRKGIEQLLQGPDTDLQVIQRISDAISQNKPTNEELLNYSKSGEAYWQAISITPLSDDSGVVYGFVAMSFDISERKKQQDAMARAKQEIEYQALHDPLTNLPNRRALDVALEERQKQESPHGTIVRIDLDHFKYVNDTMGHAAGDYLLCEVARILKGETKSTDLPVRTGGDEFVILLSSEASCAEGQNLAERMLKRIKQPKVFGNKTIRVGASFGVASTRDSSLPLETLLVGADAALYEAKDLGRNTVRLYTPELHKTVLDRRELAREIRLAIVNKEFEPYFQPQFDAQDYSIVGVETLVRWESPKFGILAPNTFLPIAQQLSAVDEIDEMILEKGIKKISSLREHDIFIPKVSFNVTAERIQNQKLFTNLERLSKLGLKISFEVLESVLVEEQTDIFDHCLDRLREIGISIEIDDFGSGHASIVGLMHLRPDVMKIDQRLVMPITDSETTKGMLEQIVGMAQLMGLHVTAEGVETMEHAQILSDLGCHTLQGYAFSKAIPIDELRHFVENWQPNAVRSKVS